MKENEEEELPKAKRGVTLRLSEVWKNLGVEDPIAELDAFQ